MDISGAGIRRRSKVDIMDEIWEVKVEMELEMYYFVQKLQTRHPGESAIVMAFHGLVPLLPNKKECYNNKRIETSKSVKWLMAGWFSTESVNSSQVACIVAKHNEIHGCRCM